MRSNSVLFRAHLIVDSALKVLLNDQAQLIIEGVEKKVAELRQGNAAVYNQEFEDSINRNLSTWSGSPTKWSFYSADPLARAVKMVTNPAESPGRLPGIDAGSTSRYAIGTNMWQQVNGAGSVTASPPLVAKGVFISIFPLMWKELVKLHTGLDSSGEGQLVKDFFGNVYDRVFREQRVDFLLWKSTGSQYVVYNQFMNISGGHTPHPHVPAIHTPPTSLQMTSLGTLIPAPVISQAVGGVWNVGSHTIRALSQHFRHTALPADLLASGASAASVVTQTKWVNAHYLHSNPVHQLCKVIALILCRLSPVTGVKKARGFAGLVTDIPWMKISNRAPHPGIVAFSRWLVYLIGILDPATPTRVFIDQQTTTVKGLPIGYTDYFGRSNWVNMAANYS